MACTTNLNLIVEDNDHVQKRETRRTIVILTLQQLLENIYLSSELKNVIGW